MSRRHAMPRTPWPACSLREAGKLLNVDPIMLTGLINTPEGKIRGIKVDSTKTGAPIWRLCREDVESLAAQVNPVELERRRAAREAWLLAHEDDDD